MICDVLQHPKYVWVFAIEMLVFISWPNIVTVNENVYWMFSLNEVSNNFNLADRQVKYNSIPARLLESRMRFQLPSIFPALFSDLRSHRISNLSNFFSSTQTWIARLLKFSLFIPNLWVIWFTTNWLSDNNTIWLSLFTTLLSAVMIAKYSASLLEIPSRCSIWDSPVSSIK